LALPLYVENLDWGQDLKVADLKKHEAVFIKSTTTCAKAIDLSREKGFD
jgi:hypothetical protein